MEPDHTPKLLINLRQNQSNIPRKYQQNYFKYPVMFKTLAICCNEGENITEDDREGVTLYFLHKSLLEEEI